MKLPSLMVLDSMMLPIFFFFLRPLQQLQYAHPVSTDGSPCISGYTSTDRQMRQYRSRMCQCRSPDPQFSARKCCRKGWGVIEGREEYWRHQRVKSGLWQRFHFLVNIKTRYTYIKTRYTYISLFTSQMPQILSSQQISMLFPEAKRPQNAKQ